MKLYRSSRIPGRSTGYSRPGIRLVFTSFTACRRAELLRGEASQLRTDNSDLSSQLESSQNRLLELSIELGQLRDDVSRLRDQIQTKDQTNGKGQSLSRQLEPVVCDLL